MARTPADTYRIRLFRSKIDSVGQGLQLPVSPTLVIQIRQWQAQIGCHTEFIVPTIHADGVVLNEPLADAQVNKILRARQQEAGLDLEPPLSNQQCRLHERSTEAINTESNSRPVNPAVILHSKEMHFNPTK